MKINIAMHTYRSKKLKQKKHYCTTCVAYNTFDLCNELQARFYAKRGKLCKNCKVVFEDISSLEIKALNRGKLYRDQINYSRLISMYSNLRNLRDSLSRGVIPPKATFYLTMYLSILRKVLNLGEDVEDK